MHRRHFLGTAVASPLIFGLDELFRIGPTGSYGDDPPPFWRQALDHMRATNRPGLVLVAPEGTDGQRLFGAKLWEMLRLREEEDQQAISDGIRDGRAAEVEPLQVRTLEILLESAVIALAPDVAMACLGRKADTAVLSPDGEVLATSAAARELVPKGPKHAAASLRAFLHGEDLARLTGFADLCRERTEPEIRTGVALALSSIREAGADEPAEALATLRAAANRIVPWLVAEKIASATERARRHLHEVIQSLARPAVVRLPFGTRLDVEKVKAEQHGCPTCGLARVPIDSYSRSFLGFLTR